MKVVAFGTSVNRNSINQQLATYAASLIPNAEVIALDLNDYEMPMVSEDREKEFGVPAQAQAFVDAIAQADLVVISFAEHNGSYTVAYKNIFDWATRTPIGKNVYQNKPLIILSTSPGPGGAKSVLAHAISGMEFFAGNVIGSLSVPNFYDVVKDGKVVDESVKQSLLDIIKKI